MQIQAHIGLLYFVTEINSFSVDNIPEEIKEFIGNKNIKANIFRVQANNSVMCGYFCIGFIDFMLAGKKLTDCTNLFSPDHFKKKYNIICLTSKMNECNSIEAIDKTI